MPAPVVLQQLMVDAMQHFRFVRWEVPIDFGTFDHYDRIVRTRIEWNSSPGVPYVHLYGTTNRIMFKTSVDGVPDTTRVAQIWLIVKQRIKDLDCDPIRLFIKPEPHKIKKIEEKRYRLISSVSVIDQILDHMVNDTMNDLMIKNHLLIAPKIGWTPYMGGWKIMPVNGHVSTDKSAWDWTVRPWLLQLWFQLRQDLCKTKNSLFQSWLRLAEHRFKCLFNKALFVTSGGYLLRAKYDGVMKSGSVDTLTGNSGMTWLLERRVDLELGLERGEQIGDIPVAQKFIIGDDLVREIPVDLKAYKNKFSQFAILKQVDSQVEFAGYRFRNMLAEPLYKGKHAYNMLHVADKVLDETANSYSLLYHRSKYRNFVRSFFEKLGADVFDLKKFDLIYDDIY